MTGFGDKETELEETDSSEESGNRTFLIVAGCLGLLVVLSMLCLGGFLFFSRNASQQANLTAPAQATQQAATVNIAIALTQTAVPLAVTQTVPLTNTVPPTNTPVISQATSTASPTPDLATMTVAAAFTQIAVSTQTIIGTSTALPEASVTDTQSVAQSSPYKSVAYLTDRLGGYSTDQIKTGKIRLKYPAHMEPETSDIFFISVYIPFEMLNVPSVPIITTPSSTPKPITSDYTTWEDEMTVAPTMRAELISLDFTVQAESASMKSIDMLEGNATTWSWIVKSSSKASIQYLSVQIYLGDAQEPLWIYQAKINVEFPTATPSQTSTNTSTPSPTLTPLPTLTPSLTPTLTPTATPIPRPQQILNVLVNNAAAVLGAFLTFITSLLGLYFLYLRPKKEAVDSKATTGSRPTKRKRK